MNASTKYSFKNELYRFSLVFVSLLFLISSFTLYERLLLKEYGLDVLPYGAGLVEALIMAKVIVGGEMLGLGQRFDRYPLIIPTLYKTFFFSFLVLLMLIVEHLIIGLFHGKSLIATLQQIFEVRILVILTKVFILGYVFFFYFFLSELNRSLPEHTIFRLFFQKKSPIDE